MHFHLTFLFLSGWLRYWASEFSTNRSGSYCLNAVLFPGSLL